MYNYIPRIVSGILSLLQSSNLRNRVYAMEDRLDILETAIEDIQRINANSSHPNTLISTICTNVAAHKHTINQHIS